MQASQQIFRLHSEYKPTGDQPQAIEKLVVFCGMWVVEHPDVVEAIVVRAYVKSGWMKRVCDFSSPAF